MKARLWMFSVHTCKPRGNPGALPLLHKHTIPSIPPHQFLHPATSFSSYSISDCGARAGNGGKILVSRVNPTRTLLFFTGSLALRSPPILSTSHHHSSDHREMGRKKKTRVPDSDDDDEQEEIGGGGGDGESSSKEKSLYGILGVERTASQPEIKHAYYKLALRLHPDKNPGDEEAKEKFQLLQKVISILGDEEKRALYDQTGCTEDDALVGEAAENLKEYFRSMFKKVTEADVEEFEANYRGSDSEKKDLKDLYTKYNGNMDRLFFSMLCSEPKLDSHRFKDIIDEAIAEGELKSTKAYQKWAKEVSEKKVPTDPLVRRGVLKKQPGTDLVAVISQRRNQRKEQFDSMFSSIVAKYDGEVPPEPTEEEFEKARHRMESKQKAGKGKMRKS